MHQRAKLAVPNTGWKWNREDIYVERLGRYAS